MMPRHKRRPPVRRRRYRLNPKVLPTLLLTLVAVGMVIMVVNLLRPDSSISAFSQPTAAPTEAPTPEATLAPAEPTAEPTPAPTEKTANEARIRAIGDVMVHDDELASALQSDGTYDFAPFFSEVAQSLSDGLHDGQSGNHRGRAGQERLFGLSIFPYAQVAADGAQGRGWICSRPATITALTQVLRWLGRDAGFAGRGGLRPHRHVPQQSSIRRPTSPRVNGIKIGVVAIHMAPTAWMNNSDRTA